jgi:hypothetical protein
LPSSAPLALDFFRHVLFRQFHHKYPQANTNRLRLS